jgi:hypothetical protein
MLACPHVGKEKPVLDCFKEGCQDSPSTWEILYMACYWLTFDKRLWMKYDLLFAAILCEMFRSGSNVVQLFGSQKQKGQIIFKHIS